MTTNVDEAKAKAIVLKLLEGGKTKADIATAIDYNRTSISRWINEPDYNGKHIAAKVLAHFDVLQCPHLGARNHAPRLPRLRPAAVPDVQYP